MMSYNYLEQKGKTMHIPFYTLYFTCVRTQNTKNIIIRNIIFSLDYKKRKKFVTKKIFPL